MDPCAVSSQNGALARCLGSCALELGCAAAGGVQWPFFFFSEPLSDRRRPRAVAVVVHGVTFSTCWTSPWHMRRTVMLEGINIARFFCFLYEYLSLSPSLSFSIYLYIYIHIISISISISIHFHQTHIGSGFLSKAPGLRRCFGSSLSGDFEPQPNCGQATGAFGDQESLWKCAQAAIFRGAGPGLMISIYSMIYIYIIYIILLYLNKMKYNK